VSAEAEGFTFDDGGREAAGFRGRAGDCVARSVAIASGRPYAEVYAALAAGTGSQRAGKRVKRSASARDGVNTGRKWVRDYMAGLGFRWVPTMRIGSGCTVHLVAEELPAGRLVVAVSKHYTAVIDGVIHDTDDPRRDMHCTEPYREPMPAGYWTWDSKTMHHVARRCVYGYWIAEEPAP
jgi:hypothetical protein